MIRWTLVVPTVLALVVSVTPARAQTTPYHLHNEASTTPGLLQLKTTGPEVATVALQSPDLKNHGAEDGTVRTFITEPNVPNLAGVVPSGSVISFTLWMKKTASYGTVYPRAQLSLNWTPTATFCTVNSNTVLTITLQPITFTCTTGAAVSMVSTDRITLVAGYHMTAGPGNKTMKVELDIEGINPSTDSYVIAPNPIPPHIDALNPTSGPVNWPVTVTGTRFGGTQGSSTVKFNGTTAAPTSWSDTSIGVPVPAGATTGPVVVRVGGADSNGVTFTVIPPPALSSLSPTSAHVGEPVTITGANFLPTRGTSTVTFNGTAATPTNWSDTTIVTPVPAGASSGNVVVTVSNQASNGLPFTVIIPGSIGGTVTRTSGGTAISGATVQAVLTGIVRGSATTAANGSYSISSLDPATYEVRVTAAGFSSELRQSIAVTPSTTTTVNVSMSAPGAISGKITQADGLTPIVGAAVTAYSGPTQKGSTNTNTSGDYSISGLHPGGYTLQAASVGYRTTEQGAVVNENSTTTLNVSLDPAPAGPVLYAYDALGRLIQVTDASGDSAIYRYDAVGNITAIERPGSSAVSISGLSRISGPVGTALTVYGSGFGATQNGSSVTFNGTSASPTTWSSTAIATTVPAGASSGPVVVTVNGVSSNGVTFTVTTGGSGPPTITGFTPTLVVAGDGITISGTNFDTTPSNDRLRVNVAAAQVTSASATSMQATVPVTTTGRVALSTQNGSGTSADYLWVAPPPYTVAQVQSTGNIAFNSPSAISVTAAGKIAMRAFEGTQGHRASASLANGNFSGGGTISIYGVYANPASAGFTSTGFLEPVVLSATGTYTFVLAPNSPGTGSATVTVYDVPADVTTAIVPGGSSVPVSIDAPGQNARLPFQRGPNNRVCATTAASTTIPSGALKVLRPDGTTLGSVNFIANFLGFLDTLSLSTTGTYTLMVDPNTTNTGTTTVTLYDVPPDTTGSVTIGGPAVPVPLASCQNGSLTFSGTQNQRVVVHVTGNNTGDSVFVKLLSSDGVTVLSQALSSAVNFDLAAATLPTAGTATYTITVDPSRTAAPSLNISVTLQ